jgi:2-methylcitrate dehydratase PrpD
MDLMEMIVKHVSQTRFEDIPDEVILITKKSVIDTLGVMIGGSSINGCRLLLDYIRDWGGRPESTVAVFGDKVPAAFAAQANGAMARALEMDDVLDAYPIHPSASIIPTVLAVADREGGVSGKDLITAVALAHDVVIRLALSLKTNPIVSGRYNLFKVFALTGCAGKLMGLTEAQLLNAMGIAYSQMVGDAQAQADGAMTSYIQQGTKGKSAIESALMAQKGITGTRAVLQGRAGFYNSFEPDPDIGVLTDGLGKRFRGLDLSIKIHSSCRATHQAIDLAQMFRQDGIEFEEIDQITVAVNEDCYRLVCEPRDRKSAPLTSVDAQFSIPFTTAAAFVRGDVFVDEISEQALKDDRILQLAKRVTPIADVKCRTDLAVGSVVMEVETRSGTKVVKQSEFPRGNPRNPISMDECVNKFMNCIGYAFRPLPKMQAEQIIELVYGLEKLDNTNRLSRLLFETL